MGYTRRVNLFTNPLFSPTGFRYGAWGVDYAKCMAGDGMLDVSKSTERDNYGPFVEIHAKLLTPGVEYVFSAQPEDDAAGRLSFWYSEDKRASAERDGDGRMTVRFTASDYPYKRCIFHNGVWSRPLLESASTFDESLPYFDYATMPREAGGGVFVLALSLLLSAALNGGWRHERGAFLYSERGTRSTLPENQEHVQVRTGSGRGRGVDVFVHELGNDIPVTRYPGRGRGRGDGGGTGLRRDAPIRRVRLRRDPGIGLDACRAPVHGAEVCRDRGAERRSGGELPAAQGRRVRRTLVAAGQISQGERWPAIARDRLEHDALSERLTLGVVA